MKVYVASPYGDSAFVRVVHERLVRHGFRPTSTWAENARGPENFAALMPAELRRVAEKNDADVRNSDAMLVIARVGAGGEMFAEARMALEYGRPIVWVGRRTLSAWRTGVLRCEDLDDALAVLVAMRSLFGAGFRGFDLVEGVAT